MTRALSIVTALICAATAGAQPNLVLNPGRELDADANDMPDH